MQELAVPGTHKKVVALALRYVTPPGEALDLGAGRGALTERLQSVGFKTTGVDKSNEFLANTRFIQLDLNHDLFHHEIRGTFDS